MPFVTAGDLSVHHALSGPEGAPVVVLSHSVGASLAMWDPQVPVLAERLRVLRYDTRGHGRTAVTAGPYSLAQLGGDVLSLLDALGVRRAHFCGLSLGGLIGMWLGVNAPDRIERLVLCNTAARIGTVEGWNARIEGVRRTGMEAMAPAVMERWFSPAFREGSRSAVAAAGAMFSANPPEGYVACCEALRDADLREALGRIRAPTLVIAGSLDVATPSAEGRRIAEAIAGARYRELPAAHLSNLEVPSAFTAELLAFLCGGGSPHA